MLLWTVQHARCTQEENDAPVLIWLITGCLKTLPTQEGRHKPPDAVNLTPNDSVDQPSEATVMNNFTTIRLDEPRVVLISRDAKYMSGDKQIET